MREPRHGDVPVGLLCSVRRRNFGRARSDWGCCILTQASLTLVLRRRDDLASYLRQSIQESLQRTAPIMHGLHDGEVRRNHYEVLERRTSDVPPTAKVFMRHYVVHWKSPWRPAHFWRSTWMYFVSSLPLRPHRGTMDLCPRSIYDPVACGYGHSRMTRNFTTHRSLAAPGMVTVVAALTG
jgi:hypothetical protein